MTIGELLVLALIAGVCGSLGQLLSGYSVGGCLVSIALGFVGALLGMWLARQLGLPKILEVRVGDEDFPIVWSIVGSLLVCVLLGVIAKQRRA